MLNVVERSVDSDRPTPKMQTSSIQRKGKRLAETSDILIIGGGVTGLTTAWMLAQEGVQVIVADRQQTGREASWAGAGMLPPGNLATAATPEARLRAFSHELWDELSAEVQAVSQIDTGYRRCGAVEVFTDAAHRQRSIDQWTAEQLPMQPLDRQTLQSKVSGLNVCYDEGVFLPTFGQVRNPRHLQALRAACLSSGVRILEHADDVRLKANSSGCVHVQSDVHHLSAARICVTAGAWSRRLLSPLKIDLPVRPVRGQIVQLKTAQVPFQHVLEIGRRYLVPRPDGLVLVGSTEEEVGFAKQTTADGLAALLKFATTLVPELGHAEVRRSWAGLRPGSPDELPFLGSVAGFDNLFVGAGHFRSGLQMSPATGRILCNLLQDRDPPISMQGLHVDRHRSTLV